MAKRRMTMALARSTPTVIALQAPRPRRGRALARRAAHSVRRHGRRAAHAAGGALWKQKTSIAAVAGAGIVGYLEGAGHLEFIPDLVPGADAVGRIPTIAIATYVAGHLAKSPKLKSAGVGLAAAAAFGYGLDKGKQAKK